MNMKFLLKCQLHKQYINSYKKELLKMRGILFDIFYVLMKKHENPKLKTLDLCFHQHVFQFL